jgi:hypothetical protein
MRKLSAARRVQTIEPYRYWRVEDKGALILLENAK